MRQSVDHLVSARSTRFTWKYPGWSGTGRVAIGEEAGFGGALSNLHHRRGGASARRNGFDAHGAGHLLRVTVPQQRPMIYQLVESQEHLKVSMLVAPLGSKMSSSL